MVGDTRVGNEENSIRAGNNRGGGDSDTNNEEDFCFSSVESIESPHNLSFEIEKSTPISREKIDQVLSHDEFLNVDEFLPLAELWTASLASDQSQLQGGVAQSSVKQSSPWRMPNPTLSTDDEPVAATVTLESWDFSKRKSVTIDLNEGSRVKIHERSFEFSNDIGSNDRFDKSIIKPTLKSSNGWNKNSNNMPSRTLSKPLSKQVLTFSGLSGHNSKRETQAHRSEDSIVIDDIDEDRTDIDDHDLPSSKKHRGAKNATLQAVFKVPPGLGLYYNRALQDHENTASSNRSSEVGDSQDNPFVVQDEDIKADDEGTSAEIESIMSEIDTANTQLNTPCSTKESKTHHFSNSNTIAEPFNRLCSPSITSFAGHERRSIHANSHNGRRSAIDSSASAIATRLLGTEHHQGPRGSVEVEEQEWEITEILEKRAAGLETKYRVHWKDTWLLSSELGSAQGLLEKFKAKGQAQHGRKRGRPARTNKGW